MGPPTHSRTPPSALVTCATGILHSHVATHQLHQHQTPPLFFHPQLRSMSLFTLKQHVNTLAPLEGDSVWVVLHNLGKVWL